MKMKKWIIAGIAVVLIAVAVVNDATQAVSVRTAEVTQGSIQAFVEERAMTSLPHIYHITMPLQGRIMPIALEEGDLVTNGQEVARIEDVDLLDLTTQIDELIIAMQNSVVAALAQVKASEERTKYAQWIWEAYDRTDAMAVSEQEKQKSKWQYLDSQVKQEGSIAAYHAMKAFDTITQMLKPFIERNLERTTVRSPVEGTILKRYVWNEKVMTPGMQVMDVGNLDELELTAEVLTEDAVHIKVGDQVQIFGESFGDAFMTGTVRRIEPQAFTKLSSLGVEQQRVNVNVAFDQEQMSTFKAAGYTFGLHYRARVRIITDEKEGTLLIPRTALFRGNDGGWQAYVVEGNRAHLVDLEIGLSNNYTAEIVSGLGAGALVIDAPESAIEDGLKISVAE